MEEAFEEYLDDQLKPLRDADGDPAGAYFDAMADEIRRFGRELIGPDGWRSKNDAEWLHDLIAEVMAMKALQMAKGGHWQKTQKQRDKVLGQLAGIGSVAKLKATLPKTMDKNERTMPAMAKVGSVAGWVLTGGLLFPLAVAITDAHAKRLNAKVRAKLKQAESSGGYYSVKKDLEGVLAKEPKLQNVAPLKPSLDPLIKGAMQARNVGDEWDQAFADRAKEISGEYYTARFFIPDAVKAKKAAKKKAATAQQRAQAGARWDD